MHSRDQECARSSNGSRWRNPPGYHVCSPACTSTQNHGNSTVFLSIWPNMSPCGIFDLTNRYQQSQSQVSPQWVHQCTCSRRTLFQTKFVLPWVQKHPLQICLLWRVVLCFKYHSMLFWRFLPPISYRACLKSWRGFFREVGAFKQIGRSAAGYQQINGINPRWI